MNRQFVSSVVLAALVGCGGRAPVESPAATMPTIVNNHVLVGHDGWEIELPVQWVSNDVPREDGDTRQVLEAVSPSTVGEVPIRLSINTVLIEPDEEREFARSMMSLAPASIVGSRTISSKMIKFDNRPASLTLLVTRKNVGLGVLAVAAHGTGYVVTCGGDASIGVLNRVEEQCHQIVSTFHVR